MATVTAYTAEHMDEIVAAIIESGAVVSGDLILTKHDGTTINAGSVAGPVGASGPSGSNAVLVVTSTTRPIAPARFTGVIIYETDTKRVYVWDGAAWVYKGGLVICTSTTRPGSPFQGLEIYETDTNKKYVYDGSAWIQIFQRDMTTFVPTVKNFGFSNVAATVSRAKYTRQGKLIIANISLALTGNSGGAGAVLVTLPVAADAGIPANGLLGTMTIYDSSAVAIYGGTAMLYDANNVYQLVSGSPSAAATNVQLGTGDSIQYEIRYEAAAF